MHGKERGYHPPLKYEEDYKPIRLFLKLRRLIKLS